MVYLLHGSDEFLRNEYLKKIKKQFPELQLGINYIQIDETNVSNLISDIETPAFGYDRKLIIAKDTSMFAKKNSNYTEEVADYLDSHNISDVELVFIEEKAEKNILYKTIEKIGKVEIFEEKKPAELAKEVVNLAKLYGVGIDSMTATYFIECVGTNMQEIINELRKLIEYEGKGNKITKEDIDLLSIRKMDAIIFDLTDSLGKKDIKRAMAFLEDLKYQKQQTIVILATLYAHFKKLYMVYLSKGQNLFELLNTKSQFAVDKYKTQAKSFTEDSLYTLMNELIQLDENYKQGLIDLDVGLESILCNYCSK